MAVYNLTVNELHTYYALADNTALLVHNCGQVKPGFFARIFGKKPNATVADLKGVNLPDIGGTSDSPAKARALSMLSSSKLLNSTLKPKDGGYLTIGRNRDMLNGNHRAAELIRRAEYHERTGLGGISWDTPIYIRGR